MSQRWLDWAMLLMLSIVWGSGFLFMRIAAPSLGPYPLVGLRLGIGALITFPFFWMARHHFSIRRLPMIVCIAVFNSALPFVLLAWAAQRAPASVIAITNATTVIFTGLISVLFFRETMSVRRMLAISLGFIGVVVLSLSKSKGVSVAPSALAGLCASISFSVGYNLAKQFLSDLPPSALSVAAMSCSALIVAPLAWQFWPSQTVVAARVWWSVLGLGAVCTGLAYCVYYRLVQRLGPSRACVVSYLIPVFGSLFSWLVLDEGLTWPMVLAEGLILGSISMGL